MTVYGPCLQLQMGNLVSSSALCLEQVNLLWVFPTGSLNSTRGGDAINSLFHCLTSPTLLLSCWNFLSTSLSQLHLLLSLGLTRASLHTPRQLQAAVGSDGSSLAYVPVPPKLIWTRVACNIYSVSCSKTENTPILEISLLHQKASGWAFPRLSLGLGEVKMYPGNCDLEYLSPGWDLEQCSVSRHCTEFVQLLMSAKLCEQGDSGISKDTCITCDLFP